MKKKILGTVLLSAVVFSNVGGSTVALAEIKDQADTVGSVNVEQGSVKPPEKPEKPTEEPGNPGDSKNPENPGGGIVVPDIPGTHNPDYPTDPGDGFTPGGNPGGPLALLGASNLKFGTIQTSANNLRKAAQAARVWVPSKYNDDGTIAADATYTATPVGNYVQFGDVRTKESGYLVNVTFKNQFTNADGEVLTGAWIDYTNGILTHADGATAAIDTFQGVTKLDLAQTVTIATVKPENTFKKGKGLYSIEYGQTGQLETDSVANGTPTTDTQGNSVFLNVPSSTAQNMKEGDYTADIIWSIEEYVVTPGNTDPNVTKPDLLPKN